MTIIKDKQGRDIRYEVETGSALAFHNGARVGEIFANDSYEIEHGYMEPAQLTGMDVNKAYRRAGIGLKMLELLHAEMGDLAPGEFNIGIGGQNAMTDEGRALTEAGQRAGYVLPFPSERPYDDDD